MTEQLLFQIGDGGLIPTSSLHSFRIQECRFKDIRHIFEKFHYKGGHMGGGISWCFNLNLNGTIAAGSVLGKARQDNKYSNGGEKKVIEIRRMACLDEAPKNIESYFLGKICWWLKKNSDIQEVLSYSDKSVGHKGTIYRAANFKLIGETSPSVHIFWDGVRYHPRSLTIDRPYSYRLREALKNGTATKEVGEPKLIFKYDIRR